MSNPLLLITHYEKHQQEIDNYLPFSIGIEIECSRMDSYSGEFFARIPYIMEIKSDSTEQRYRIPNGLRGLVCLYILSLTCKQQLELNPASGIHYHCDLTGFYAKFKESVIGSELNKSYILSELDKWEYKGRYNSRQVSSSSSSASWARFQDTFHTMEIRIGEMTFDYEVLIERILHITSIVTRMCSTIGVYGKSRYEKVSQEFIYDFLKNGVHIYDASVKASMDNLLNEKNRLLSKLNKPIEEESFSKSRIVKLY